MKKTCLLFGFILLLNCNSVSYSQKLSAGLLSGMSFSDIHGNDNSGNWRFKPGSFEKLFVSYNLNRVLGFQSGLSFSSIYYEHLPYVDRTEYPSIGDLTLHDGAPMLLPMEYPVNKKLDFNFLTIPAQFTISIPSRPQLNISAGVFYSFLTAYSLNIYYPEEPEKNDFGFLFSTGLSYPLTENLNALLNFGYIAGQKKFLGNYDYRHGFMDLSFGISWDGFLKNKTEGNGEDLKAPSGSNIDLIYRTCINFIWNSGSLYSDKYDITIGPSLGFAVDFILNNWLSLQTGISWEKNGYALRDSSISTYRYYDEISPQYFVDTRIGIDYITVPALVNLSFGSKYRFFINTGPYFALKMNAFCKGEAYNALLSGPGFKMTKTVVSDDIGWTIKDTDFGWIAGGGITLPVSEKINIDLGLQYHKGFRDVGRPVFSSEDYAVRREETLIKNNSLSLMVGLRIPVN